MIWLSSLGAFAQGEAANWFMYGGKMNFSDTAVVWSPFNYPFPHNYLAKVNVSDCNGDLLFQYAQHQNNSTLWHFYDSTNISLASSISNNSSRIDAVRGSDSTWLVIPGGLAAPLALPSDIQMIKVIDNPAFSVANTITEATLKSYGQITSKRDSAYGYWLIYYDLPNNQLVSLPFDQYGFYVSDSVNSDTLPEPQFFIQQNLLEISPDLTSIAMADFNSNIIHLWRFDNTSGRISNRISISAENLGAFNIQNRIHTLCFSKYGSKLYFKASNNLNHPGMYQIDLTNWDSSSIITSSRYIFSPNKYYSFPTLGSDGNIYFNSGSILLNDTLSYGRIINSDSLFQSSNLEDNLFPFVVQTGWSGYAIATLNKLPNTPAYSLNPNRYSIVAQNFCLGDSTRLHLYDYQNLDSVAWDFGDGSSLSFDFAPTHLYSAPGAYTVAAYTRYCNRPDTLYYQLEILGLPRLPFADTSICSGDSLFLQLPANAHYSWSTGDTSASLVLSTPGIYSVNIHNGCFSATDSFELRIVEPASTYLPVDTGFCWGDSVWIDPGASVDSLLWPDGSRGPRWVNSPGNYTLELSNACGTVNHTISIGVYGTPPLNLNDTSICDGRVLRIDLPDYWQTDYLWQDGSTDRQRTLTDSGRYIVSAQNPCGSLTDSFQLAIRDCNCTLYLPNAFSPNNDGVNDEFKIISPCPLRDFELFIYDRWGQNIFRATNNAQAWDGNFQNKPLPTGAYAYVLHYTPEGGSQKVDSGVIMLIR